MLPLVERELRVASKKRETFFIRSGVAFLAIVVGAITLLGFRPSSGSGYGRGIFTFFSVVSLFYCFFQALRQTADCISVEKREGTIGLLFLTDLRSFEIVTGKLAANGIQTFAHLLGFFPLLSLCILFGGVTGKEFALMTLLLTNTLFVTLSLGILASSLCFRATHAVILTLAMLMGLLIVPMLFAPGGINIPSIAGISPYMASLWITSGRAVLTMGEFFAAQALAHLLGWIILLASGRILATNWQVREQPKVRAVQRINRGEQKLKARLLDQNPFMWLTYRPGERQGFYWLFYGMLALFLLIWIQADFAVPVLNAANFLLTLLFFLYLCSQASRNFAEATRSEAFEIILATPMTIPKIIDGQFMALKKFFLIPGIVLSAMKLLLTFSGEPGDFWIVTDIFSFALMCVSISWFGMWMGLTRGPTRAFFATLFWAYMIPSITCCGAIVISLVLFSVARQKVEDEFRKVVVQKYQNSQFFKL